MTSFNSMKTQTLLVHAGLFWCFFDPLCRSIPCKHFVVFKWVKNWEKEANVPCSFHLFYFEKFHLPPVLSAVYIRHKFQGLCFDLCCCVFCLISCLLWNFVFFEMITRWFLLHLLLWNEYLMILNLSTGFFASLFWYGNQVGQLLLRLWECSIQN